MTKIELRDVTVSIGGVPISEKTTALLTGSFAKDAGGPIVADRVTVPVDVEVDQKALGVFMRVIEQEQDALLKLEAAARAMGVTMDEWRHWLEKAKHIHAPLYETMYGFVAEYDMLYSKGTNRPNGDLAYTTPQQGDPYPVPPSPKPMRPGFLYDPTEPAWPDGRPPEVVPVVVPEGSPPETYALAKQVGAVIVRERVTRRASSLTNMGHNQILSIEDSLRSVNLNAAEEQLNRRPLKPGTRYGTRKTGANDPCPCGSMRKYKKCCR